MIAERYHSITWRFFCIGLLIAGSCTAEKTESIRNVTDTLSPATPRTISFSGYQWTVREHPSAQGPGPNYFRQQQVWVDANGWLHLLLSKDSVTGNWLAAEITSQQNFGFGMYRFLVDGRPDRFDKNIVFGLFNYSGRDGYDEMDIEFARWGNAAFPNLNYTIWPAKDPFKNAATTHEFSLNGNLSLHQFLRSADTVTCSSFQGAEALAPALIYRSVFASPPASVSQLSMPVHINLWLFNGNPPGDGQRVEVIIRRFTFIPG